MMKKIVLGSGSPRRAQLLKEMGFQFEVRPSDIDEIVPEEIGAIASAEFLARLKNEHLMPAEDEIILTADTVVIYKNEILGKPVDKEEAKSMLTQLSDQAHLVISGVCIRDIKQTISFSTTTEVKFKELSPEEIDFYVEEFKPLDKAGAYGIQEWIGLVAVEWIKGSYFNVVGLPCDQVYHHLTLDFGINISK
ncbi:MAG: Maf family nucleotide pyrophosphatase [Cyclobacteriaceae bacterium]